MAGINLDCWEEPIAVRPHQIGISYRERGRHCNFVGNFWKHGPPLIAGFRGGYQHLRGCRKKYQARGRELMEEETPVLNTQSQRRPPVRMKAIVYDFRHPAPPLYLHEGSRRANSIDSNWILPKHSIRARGREQWWSDRKKKLAAIARSVMFYLYVRTRLVVIADKILANRIRAITIQIR